MDCGIRTNRKWINDHTYTYFCQTQHNLSKILLFLTHSHPWKISPIAFISLISFILTILSISPISSILTHCNYFTHIFYFTHSIYFTHLINFIKGDSYELILECIAIEDWFSGLDLNYLTAKYILKRTHNGFTHFLYFTHFVLE